MKKFVLGLVACICLCFGCIFAQTTPDGVDIKVKSPIIKGEYTNLEIAITKNGNILSSYGGKISMIITDETGSPLKDNEYTLPNRGNDEFTPSDLGKKTYQRGLKIDREGKFYIEVSDRDESFYGKQEIIVINDNTDSQHDITIHTPVNGSTLINGKVEIIANCPKLPNSDVLIYIDNSTPYTAKSDENGSISYIIPNVSQGKHNLMLEIINFEGNSLGISDTISFVYTPDTTPLLKNFSIDPTDSYFVGDIINISVETTELAESAKLFLSNDDSYIMSKHGNEFSQNIYLVSTGVINFSLEIYSANNTQTETHNDLKTITVSNLPEVYNINTDIDEENNKALITWDTTNSEFVSKFIFSYGFSDDPDSWETKETSSSSFKFSNVPYDKDIYYQITPYIQDSNKHGAASKTIQFIIKKPDASSPVCGGRELSCDVGNVANAKQTNDSYIWQCKNEDNVVIDCEKKIDEETFPGIDPECGTDAFTCIWGSVYNTGGTLKQGFSWMCVNNEGTSVQCKTEPDKSCNVQNIKTHTQKIGDKYYLMRDKVENIAKYVVYSSETPNISDRIKVYETTDTSYEYPFDHSVEEDQFMYFWVDGLCEDGEQLQLSGATKVQVGPAEDFFLLVCLTILIFAGIKIFRFTEE